MYINASLIREARMIYQNIFGRGPAGNVRSESMPTLKCAFCIVIRKRKPENAITTVNGQAVCHDHMHYVQDIQFNNILERIRRDETKSKRA